MEAGLISALLLGLLELLLLLLLLPKTALQRSECWTVLVALRSSHDISAVVSDILRRIFSCFHTWPSMH